jgi:hypothetical protein
MLTSDAAMNMSEADVKRIRGVRTKGWKELHGNCHRPEPKQI